MIVKFNNNAIVRSSEVVYAHFMGIEGSPTNPLQIHISFKGDSVLLKISYNSMEKAEKELDRLMKAMEADLQLEKKPKKIAPRRKIR